MYEAFYGLKERPFNLTPDPKYLYLSDKHKEAFAHLLFGIKNRSGFVMVTGEIGTGKTTICRNLLNQIDAETRIAFIFNPALNPLELIKKINVEFGVSAEADNVLQLTETLNAYLLEQAAQGNACVLVIDEAQNLSPQVLEQIRLLSNLETETDKLLQIVLIGQPELGEKLALHELRQLNQRITARYHLKPLDEHETLQYIAYRLHVAGGRRKIQFSKTAVKSVYKYSGGTPRVINALCDRALLIGYTKEAVNITAAIIKQAASEIRGEKVVVERPWSTLLRQFMPSPALALTAAIVIASVWYLTRSADRVASEIGRFNDIILPPPAGTPTAPAANNAVEAKSDVPPASAAQTEEQIRAAAREEVAKALVARLAPGAAAPPSDDGQAFRALLDTLAPEAALVAAGETLLGAWGVAPQSPALAENSPAGVEAYFERHGLMAEKLKPGVEQLIAINLPALVRVKHAQKQLWLPVLSASNSVITLGHGKDQKIEVPVGVFREVYLSETVVPWKDPEPRATAMSIGRAGAAIADLKAWLRGLGRLDAANTSDQYDQDTARAISQIQAETGLVIDGVAGRQVRMVMSAWRDTPGVPTLRGASKAAPAAATVEIAAPAKGDTPQAASAPAAPETTPLPTPEALKQAVNPDAPNDGKPTDTGEEKKPESAIPDAPKTEGKSEAAPAADAVVTVTDLPKPEATVEAPPASTGAAPEESTKNVAPEATPPAAGQ